MAEEIKKDPNDPDNGLDLEAVDNSPFEELGIDIDQINKEVSQISPQKVELDTSGLDLDFDSEPEPAADLEELEEELPEEEEELEPETGRPGWFWPLVLGGSGVVLAVLVAVVGYFTWWAEEPLVATKDPDQGLVRVTQDLPTGVPLLAMPEFSVPLNNEKRTLLKISVHLALKSEAAKAALMGQTVRIRDMIYRSLLALSQGELKTGEQRLALREKLTARLNRSLSGSPVREIYFTQFLLL